MREYRGWYKDKWVYGGLIKPNYRDCCIDTMTHSYCIEHEYSIGQYIGIKDINERKIFEGDIVKCVVGGIQRQGVVFYSDDYASYYIKIRHVTFKWFKDVSSIEVIDNIYEAGERQ